MRRSIAVLAQTTISATLSLTGPVVEQTRELIGMPGRYTTGAPA